MLRCLIVDDSASFRQVLREILKQLPELEVVGEAEDGETAVKMALELRPDIITMDLRMPKRNGPEAIREIMNAAPAAIVAVCAAANAENVALGVKALEFGALDVLEKPDASNPEKHKKQLEAICEAVKAVGVHKSVRPTGSKVTSKVVSNVSVKHRASCIGLVGSTGGPKALCTILAALPKTFPVPILVAQHVAAGFTQRLAEWLDSECDVTVRVAQAGDALQAGTVLIAPENRHLMVSMGKVRLDDGPPVRSARPSGTVLLTSIAREFGDKGAGIVLTGMGEDGQAGLALVQRRGGFTAAQGPNSSTIFGMPKVALDSGAAAFCLEIEQIAPALLTLAGITRTQRKVLLLVDDAETMLQVEQQALSSAYDVHLARNGKEAVEKAETLKPDGILMDYSMPIMNGGQALVAIRKSAKTSTIPVIMVTSEKNPKLLQSCWDGGCNAIVQKPIDMTALQNTVKQFVPP
ncbi:MAG: chemotaxis-specific protein-glutamate methyltransferase CheB [Myxococcaceae bacterium]